MFSRFVIFTDYDFGHLFPASVLYVIVFLR